MIRFLDLFAGLGGFHLAASQLGGQCVLASEIDDRLQGVYQKNFGISPEGDIRRIDPRDVPQHDLLCAGFPCQPFSKAGDQMGWRDAVRGTVFFNIVEILRVRRPQFVILENVAHFVRHDAGNTYAKVVAALESLGYAVDHRILSPHQFGIPQIRNRMYLVGRQGSLEGFAWPKPYEDKGQLSIRSILDSNPPEAKPLSDQVIRCLTTWQEFLETIPEDTKLPSFPIWSMEFKATYPYHCDSLGKVPLRELRKKHGSFGQSLDRSCSREILPRVPSYARAAKGAFPKWKQAFISHNRDFWALHQTRLKPWMKRIKAFPPSLQKLEWNCQGEKRDIWKYVIQFRASGVRVKRPTTSPSLVAMTTTQVPIIAWERRYMTVRECARLQSMDCLKHLPAGGAAMAALGNAVNVTVARLILKQLLKLG